MAIPHSDWLTADRELDLAAKAASKISRIMAMGQTAER
jgi:hypothetical protein